MNERKVIIIDVSKMSLKEIHELLNIPYIPWYKSTTFWLLAILFCMPSIIQLMWVLR